MIVPATGGIAAEFRPIKNPYPVIRRVTCRALASGLARRRRAWAQDDIERKLGMIRRGFWLVPALALIGACSSEKQEEQKAVEQLTLHEMMVQKIDVDADAIWTIGNAAINDQASIDPAKMTDKN